MPSADSAFLFYRVDQPNNLFAQMRRLQGYQYDDRLDADRSEVPALKPAQALGQVLFWPGCTLSSYAQGLTQSAYALLRERGLADALSVHCCGRILRFSADKDAQAKYAQHLTARLLDAQVKRVIVACPGCYDNLTGLLAGGPAAEIELLALPAVLVEQGYSFAAASGATGTAASWATASGAAAAAVATDSAAPGTPAAWATASGAAAAAGATASAAAGASGAAPAAEPSATPFRSICVHDSCPDRQHGVFADAIRALAAGLELREPEHNRQRTHCCGLGKLLSLRQPQQSQKLTADRLDELKSTGADLVMTSCLTCTNAFQEEPGPNGSAGPVPNGSAGPASNGSAGQAGQVPDSPAFLHYLELLFGQRIDWSAVRAAGYQASQDLAVAMAGPAASDSAPDSARPGPADHQSISQDC